MKTSPTSNNNNNNNKCSDFNTSIYFDQSQQESSLSPGTNKNYNEDFQICPTTNHNHLTTSNQNLPSKLKNRNNLIRSSKRSNYQNQLALKTNDNLSYAFSVWRMEGAWLSNDGTDLIHLNKFQNNCDNLSF